MKLSPLRLSFLAAAATFAVPILESQAALLVYEPFDYINTQGDDQNQDGKKDLMGLDGGQGFATEWLELAGATGTTPAGSNHPLDYINDVNLGHPSGDPRFGEGGSLEIFGNALDGSPTQLDSRLIRSLAAPISLTEGSEVWLSLLIRKNAEQPVSGTTDQTRPGDRLEIGLFSSAFNTANNTDSGFYMGDPSDSTSFGMRTNWTNSQWPRLNGLGATLGTTNFLVMRLYFERGESLMEFFYNPSLEEVSPSSNLSIPLVDSALDANLQLDQLMIRLGGSSRPVWTLDEIRVGETYTDVVPEPSSLLLTSFGVAMFGGARLRRSRVS